jgi:hypothetical protein
MKYTPLHPLRENMLERTLRQEWEKFLAERPGFDFLCGPEVRFSDIPAGMEYEENNLTGGYQPFPYGKMNGRDKMIATELIQWLGTPCGMAFFRTAFEKAGGVMRFDDYSKQAGAAKGGTK